jgi:hypothetical protein
MTANASLYLASAASLPLDFLQRMVPFAEISALPAGDGHAGACLIAAPAWSLRLSIMPAEQVARHLGGFSGWIATVTGRAGKPLEQQTPGAQLILRHLQEVKLVLGCVVEPNFDSSGYARRTLAAIARPGRGFLFADNAVYGPDGARVLGARESPPRFLPTELSDAQRWTLAATAIVTRYFEHSHELLGGTSTGDEDQESAKETLLDPWGIEKRSELFDMLKHLSQPEAKGGADDAERKSRLADYLCRLIYLVGVGYVAGLVSESEAWGYALGAAMRLQRGFSSWEELGQHYLAGVAMRRGEDEELAQSYEELLADPASPWRAIAWSAPLM